MDAVGYALASSLKAGVFTQKLTAKRNLPQARRYLSHNAPVVNGKVYIIGGNVGATYYKSNWEYNPITDTFTVKADMPTGRCDLSTAAANGKIYAIRGDTGSGLTGVNEEYDPATNTWTTKGGTIPGKGSAVVSFENQIYLIGGYDSNGNIERAVRVYNPITDTWTSKAVLPSYLYNGMAVDGGNGKIYHLGGSTDVVSQSSVFEYDPVGNTWTSKRHMIFSNADACAVLVENEIYCFGGITTYIQIYDISQNQWKLGTLQIPNRRGFAACAIGSKIYLFGGTTGADALNTTYELDIRAFEPIEIEGLDVLLSWLAIK